MKNILLAGLLLISLPLTAKSTDSLNIEMRLAKTSRQKAFIALAISKVYYGNNMDSAQRYAGLALGIAEGAQDDSLIMESEAVVADIYQNKGLISMSLAHNEKAIVLARKANNKMLLMGILMMEGYSFRDQRKNANGIAVAQAALSIAISSGNKIKEQKIYSLLSSLYTQENNYTIAFSMLEHSMQINDSLISLTDLADNYQEAAIIYGQQKKYTLSLHYNMMQDSLCNIIKDDRRLIASQLNMAITYKNLKKYDKAISIYKQLLIKKSGDTYTQMYIYVNMGIAFSAKGMYKDAIESFLHVKAINEDNYHDKYIGFNYDKELANTFLLQHMLDSALYYGLLAERTDSGNNPHMQEYDECIALLANIYTERGDLMHASNYYKKYNEIQDTAIARLRQEKEADAAARFRLDENNRQLSLLVNRNERAEHNVHQQQAASIMLTIGLLLGGVIIFIIVVAYRRSVRKNRQLQEQKLLINQQLEQIAATADMKSRFLANISHELRTPITLLTGTLELVQEKSSMAAERENLKIAYNNSRKLQVMIEEILDLSRVESKNVVLDCKVTDILPLLKRTVLAFGSLTAKKQLRLDYRECAELQVYICIDEDKFEKIINNLVYNAIKFNKTGGEIKVSPYVEAGNKQFVIEVSDTGIGIPAADLPYIFERFYQVSNAEKGKAEGVGIGLSLVKEFTEMLEGTIKVASTPGYGTVFTLAFAIAEQGAADIQPEAPAENNMIPATEWQRVPGKHMVLVVEDNDEMRYYIKQVLGENISVAEAANGRHALEWLHHHIPDLIITDMMMPEMDGREFTGRLKGIDACSKVPVIMLTALANKENQLEMLRIGVDDYIIKPFDATELRVRVDNLLRNLAVREEAANTAAEPEDTAPGNNEEAAAFREKIKVYVLANIKQEDISVDDIAAELGVSKRQLYRITQEMTGYTPAQMVKEIRLQKAYELLQSGDIQKIENVSRQVGFATTAYFSRQFLERFGKKAIDFLK